MNRSNIQVFTKIQQAQPSYLSTLLNKEVGYFVHVETDKVYKIKNCIDSQKTNSEIYKRFSKDFISSIKNGVDQMILCCGLQESSRIETSMGNKKNPGLFLIAGIGVLDEKYQQDFTKFDIEISFMEYLDGKMYDLLSNTRVPLKMIKKDQTVSFGENVCKVATFSQFLKLFKIALFNNKQRDIKIEDSFPETGPQQKIKSSLIMTIVTKKYMSFPKNSVQTQKSIIIDFANSRPSGSHLENNMQRNIWDYVIIELNNLSNKKKLHYHLVEPNPLLSLTKQFLRNGKSIFVPSFNTNPQSFEASYQYITSISDLIDSTIPSIQPSPLVSLNNTTQKWVANKVNSEKQQALSIEQSIKALIQLLKNKKYDSLRQYRDLKQRYLFIIGNLLQWNQGYKKTYSKLFENKRRTKFAENQIISDQFKLIGVCVKSDHYKDFYDAKSYLALEREVAIKTQDSRQLITKLLKARYELKDKFGQAKAKQLQMIDLILTEQDSDLLPIKLLSSKIVNFLCKTFFNILLDSQRTIIDEVIREESIIESIGSISKGLVEFQSEIKQMSKNGKILFEMSDFKKDAHLYIFANQVQGVLQKDKHKNKRKERSKKSAKKQKQNTQIEQNTKHVEVKFTKLPLLPQKKTSFQIIGNLDLASLLFDPSQSSSA